jgi:hypothetical protein
VRDAGACVVRLRTVFHTALNLNLIVGFIRYPCDDHALVACAAVAADPQREARAWRAFHVIYKAWRERVKRDRGLARVNVRRERAIAEEI